MQDPLHDGRAKEARRDTSLRDLLEQLLTSLTMDTLESPSTRPLSKAAFLCRNPRSRISNSNFLFFSVYLNRFESPVSSRKTSANFRIREEFSLFSFDAIHLNELLNDLLYVTDLQTLYYNKDI